MYCVHLVVASARDAAADHEVARRALHGTAVHVSGSGCSGVHAVGGIVAV